MEKDYIKLLFLCFAGFVLAIIVLFIRMPGKASNFGEVQIINKDTLVHDELQKQSDFYYKQALLRYGKTKKKLEIKDVEDRSTSLFDTLKEINKLRDAHHLGNADTSLNTLTKLFHIKREALSKQMAMRNWPEDTVVHVDAYNSARGDTAMLNPKVENHPLHLKYIPQAKFMSFVSKYPIFGFWAFFTIAQSTIWFLLFSFFSENYRLFTNAVAVKVVVKSMATGPNPKKLKLLYFRDILWTLLLLGLFCLFLYEIIIDSWVIDDHFFLSAYSTRMLIYALFGYLFAAVCLSVNFPIIRMLNQANGLINTSQKEEAKKLLVDVNNIFNFAFYTCAFVLSLFIIWSSLVVTGINQLEMMSLYKILTGRFYIPVDYVYLIGFIHSLILLIFFVPTYLILKNMVNKVTPPPEGESGKTALQKLITGLTSNLGVVLVTASPILSSFFQSMLTLI